PERSGFPYDSIVGSTPPVPRVMIARPQKLRPKVLLADDHAVVRDGLRLVLEGDFDIVGAVEDGRALVKEAERLRPDVVLVDISMPMLNGIEAARRLHRALPR